VVSVSDDVLANFEVFFKAEVLLVDVGAQIVEISLSNLFRGEL
jgi:hypothetical protein